MTDFTIITPCYNAERYIRETIRSILNQTALISGRATLQYIIVDGGSTDNTLAIVEQETRGFRAGTVEIISGPDQGMYDALAKGLRRAEGEICAYLNADDLYSPHAFDIVLDVQRDQPVQWLTGMQVGANQKGQLVQVITPFRYLRRLIACGLYDGVFLIFIQQESTFWRRELNALIDFERLAQFRLAGDFYLWTCFCQRADLIVVQAHLGAFRIHAAQLSAAIGKYYAEMRQIARPPKLADRVVGLMEKIARSLPPSLRRWLNRGAVLEYDHAAQAWRY